MTEIERQILINQNAMMDCLASLIDITSREVDKHQPASMSVSKMHKERLALLRADTRDMLDGKITKATREFVPCLVCGTKPIYNHRINISKASRSHSIQVECPHKNYSAHKNHTLEISIDNANSQAEAMRMAIEAWNNLMEAQQPL